MMLYMINTIPTFIYSSHNRELIGSGVFHGFQTKLLTWNLDGRCMSLQDPELQLLYAEVRRQRNCAASWEIFFEMIGRMDMPVEVIPFVSFYHLFYLRQH